jgi:predicted membrane channel-forming protein YqfA (hemolysin III family)
MNWHPDLAKLFRLLTRIVIWILGASGVLMAILSPHSKHAALYAVIFLGIALALIWAISRQSERR